MTIGRLNMVDLAGSERVKTTGITDGKHLEELKRINSSLTTFGKVILALTSAGNLHVPYRDSKLTRILQGSLGGNCKTTMITAITPSQTSSAESLASLKFAFRAKNVKNFAVVNQDLSEQALLSAYEKEIKRLRRELEKSKASPADSAPRPDPNAIASLEREHTELKGQKSQIESELRSHQEELERHRQEKEQVNPTATRKAIFEPFPLFST